MHHLFNNRLSVFQEDSSAKGSPVAFLFLAETKCNSAITTEQYKAVVVHAVISSQKKAPQNLMGTASGLIVAGKEISQRVES